MAENGRKRWHNIGEWILHRRNEEFKGVSKFNLQDWKHVSCSAVQSNYLSFLLLCVSLFFRSIEEFEPNQDVLNELLKYNLNLNEVIKVRICFLFFSFNYIIFFELLQKKSRDSIAWYKLYQFSEKNRDYEIKITLKFKCWFHFMSDFKFKSNKSHSI